MFENRLKALRESKKYNMRQMAQALKIPYTTYVNYEKNEREPNSEFLIRIAKYFNVSTDYLLGKSHVESVHKTDDELKFALFNGSDGVTDEMFEEVKKFAEMVKLREDAKKK